MSLLPPAVRRSIVAAAAFVISIISLLGATPVQACSSCGCSLGTDWSDTGLTTASGLKVDFRYDFVDQNQLRLGRAPVSPDAANPPSDLEEIQKGTLTNFYTVTADYTFNRDWGINVSLPYLIRLHQTLPLDDGNTTEIDTSDYSGVGDLRIVGRFQGLLEDKRFGLQFGFKLPTGSIHNNFATGPDANAAVDRGLQPGTGTTDLILGAYYHGSLGMNWDHFEQVQWKEPLNSREQFRPSPQIGANLGLRYVASPVFVPQVQLNFKWEGRELGEQADYANSGSRVVYLSPGASVRIAHPVHAYAFVQLPVYQDYTGYQLAPHYTLSAGLNYHF